MNDAELVGGALFHVDDPVVAAQALARILTTSESDPARIRAGGLEPALVQALRRRLPTDPKSIEIACANGAAWVLGYRASKTQETWEVVASLPANAPLPLGLRRTTGETMIGLASTAQHRIRLAAPYVDESGIGFLVDPLVAATRRGVIVEMCEPGSWEPARVATAALVSAVINEGDPTRFRLKQALADAPFAHLKVMVVDGVGAYIGSANITAAGLAGRNLELGVLVRGSQVAVIDRFLDLFQEG